MTTIYLIRHGQTDWNKKKIFRGRADVPLNDHGRKEARALSRHLKQVRPAACYSSPLSRARETAEIVVRPHSLDVEPDEGIIDVDYGRWQGMSDAAVSKQFAETYKRWHERPHRVKFPGGESLMTVRKRALSYPRRLGVGCLVRARRHQASSSGRGESTSDRPLSSGQTRHCPNPPLLLQFLPQVLFHLKL